jgi:hypothetical protein
VARRPEPDAAGVPADLCVARVAAAARLVTLAITPARLWSRVALVTPRKIASDIAKRLPHASPRSSF